METIYSDIAARTGGNIYIGVVGPVRTGKSTLIKRIMEAMVIPAIPDPNRAQRARDELPQSGSGKTIMTSEPKFIPEEAVEISPDGVLTAHPLLPEKSWDHFLLDGLPVAGHSAAVQYDRDGSCYGRGAGLTLYVDGEAVDRCNAPDARVRFLLKRS